MPLAKSLKFHPILTKDFYASSFIVHFIIKREMASLEKPSELVAETRANNQQPTNNKQQPNVSNSF